MYSRHFYPWQVQVRSGKASLGVVKQGKGCLQRSPDSKSPASGDSSHHKARLGRAGLGWARLGMVWRGKGAFAQAAYGRLFGAWSLGGFG